MTRCAVVLLSGGLDSTTTLALARRDGFTPHAMTFRYGQRHEAEIEASRKVAAAFGVREHVVVEIDLRLFGGSALTTDVPVPKGRSLDEMGHGIPITYVPARNTIFLSFALAWAETLGAQDVFIGVNALDYSGYPDCRPEYIAAYEAMANLATRDGVEGRQRLRIHTPLINLTKAQIVSTGLALGVDYSVTSTCYDPDAAGRACGACDACLLRLRGFAENGLRDPAPYQAEALVVAYGVKEVFYTLQGEGTNAGRAAVFLRFAGCNLWNGREDGRAAGTGGCARWCDTDFVGFNGEGGGKFPDAEGLAEHVRRTWRGAIPPGLVVCTGGEPLLQLDDEIIGALHRHGFEIAIETNGTLPVPAGVDWVCVSPKAGGELVVVEGDELKLVVPQVGMEPDRFEALSFRHRYLQPLDGPQRAENTRLAIEYCLAHPTWRLSTQTHKFLGIP